MIHIYNSDLVDLFKLHAEMILFFVQIFGCIEKKLK